jgi:RNA polymerase sigma-70 factor (ECF subfamily)
LRPDRQSLDGEDLVQDVLLRVFGQLGKLDPDVAHPRAYLIRAATHLWIDRLRRAGVERAHARAERERAPEDNEPDPAQKLALRDAASRLFLALAPQERAAVLLKDVLDFSLEESAAMLQTSVGAVKAALHRGRTRLREAERQPEPARASSELVEHFVDALARKDFDALRALCRADVTVELVGGVVIDGYEQGKTAFEHAHWSMSGPEFPSDPRWEVAYYEGEPIALGFRTRNGKEGLNEVWRLVPGEGGLSHVRLYCFTPDTLHTLAKELGLRALRRPYRSP